ncbi:MAG: carbamoyltransferase HypF [Dehalococcoidales bacterium]
MAKTPVLSLARINVRGVVQGVGFRPFVYQLATRHNLKGWVCNTSGDVSIEVEGDSQNIEQFVRELQEKAPPLAHIREVTVAPGPPAGYPVFKIRPSLAEEGKYQLVSPDIATCPDCLREIFDPADRRYRYPFTNCTNCGPRFTIIADIPYDRPNTTMKNFRMCPQCQQEYDDPRDRRFHAQPNACPVCGPQLQLLDATEKQVPCADIIQETASLLGAGRTVAVKGLGGFLLACDASDDGAVGRLRRRKKRPAKPLAVMVESIDEAKKHCYVNSTEEELLRSPGSPIVLMRWKANSTIARSVAPGLDHLGVMLPYTPLHHLVMRATGLPLVMTSGNLSEEPIAKDNGEAVQRLAGIADFFLVHNRDIYARYDDSVMMVVKNSPQFIRRARGFAPHPIRLKNKSRQILGCGAEEKNTFCLTRDDYAFVSQHIGDMENIETLEHFTNTIELYKKLFRINPEIIACDLHPEYLPTKYAQELATGQNISLVLVQHHHAHIAGCLAENGAEGPVIGVALDGTGYGTDGQIWGGEFLVADYQGFQRLAHLEYLPLPGGALAIKKPYRTAIGYLLALGIYPDDKLPLNAYLNPAELGLIKNQVEKKINAPLTSSMGRLFDAVAALIGVRGLIQYEAQAAIELEVLARGAESETGKYPFAAVEQDGVTIIKIRDLLASIISDLQASVPKEVIAVKFHNTVVNMIVDICSQISKKTGLKGVVLSGGVFQNRLLLSKTAPTLEAAGFKVYTHHQVPCNDGCISLGQVVVGNSIWRKNND